MTSTKGHATPSSSFHILAAVSDPNDHHLIDTIISEVPDWKADYQTTAKNTFATLKKGPLPSLLLTDLKLPDMGGIDFMEELRDRFPTVPVVLISGFGKEEEFIKALKMGAASYVPKVSLATDLISTIEEVQSVCQAQLKQQRMLDCLQKQESQFVFGNDVNIIPVLVNHFEKQMEIMKICPANRVVHLGVALHEALTNAVLHGNLELSSKTKQEDEKLYYRMAAERQKVAPYKDRQVFVTSILTRDEARFIIRDEGPGFDPSQLPDPTDPSNLENPTGRGLFLIHSFMDEVSHNSSGNEITIVKKRC